MSRGKKKSARAVNAQKEKGKRNDFHRPEDYDLMRGQGFPHREGNPGRCLITEERGKSSFQPSE